jgi:hypothetical protein
MQGGPHVLPCVPLCRAPTETIGRSLASAAPVGLPLSQPLCSMAARRPARALAEQPWFDLAYRLLNARDQIVANPFLHLQRVVNASELVAHLHENVRRVVGAIGLTVEVELGPKIGYEVNKQLFT